MEVQFVVWRKCWREVVVFMSEVRVANTWVGGLSVQKGLLCNQTALLLFWHSALPAINTSSLRYPRSICSFPASKPQTQRVSACFCVDLYLLLLPKLFSLYLFILPNVLILIHKLLSLGWVSKTVQNCTLSLIRSSFWSEIHVSESWNPLVETTTLVYVLHYSLLSLSSKT